MPINPQYSEINFIKSAGEKKESVQVSCRLDVPTESVLKVISLSVAAHAVPDGSGEEPKLSGKAIFCLCYEDVEGSLKKYECKKDFFVSFDITAEQKLTDVRVKAEKTEYDTSGVNLSVSALLSVFASVTEKVSANYLSGGEGIIVNGTEREITKNYGAVFGAFPVTEEFELPYPIKAVLTHKAEMSVTSVQCGVGSVIIDGEVIITALVLSNAENGAIIKECKNIPVRIDAEYEEAMPVFRPTASAFVKSFKTDVTVDETNGKSTVEVSLSVGYEVSAFSSDNILIATDAFSKTENVSLEYGEIEFIKPCGERFEREKQTVKVALGTLSASDEVICLYNDYAEVVSFKAEGDALEVALAYTADAVIKGENGYRTEKIMSPAIVKLNEFNSLGELSVSALAFESDFKKVSGDELEISFTVALHICGKERATERYIKSVRADGEKQTENSGFSVYIALSGEDLWSLSKRLNVCPDELTEGNKDLKFPLSGDERIVVYRKR